MENEITTVRESREMMPAWTQEQVDLIKRTVAKDTTNDELALFLHAAKRSGLDPLAKQIHCVKRKGGMAIQTAIDGYRLIADRTGKYAGNDDPVFDDEKNPKKASVTVYKIVGGQRCAFTATARWDQYFPGEAQGFMWKKMPHLMLGKCAEALALRKAFPAEMSGIYTNEEMEQAETRGQNSPEMARPAAKPLPPTSPTQKEPIEGQASNAGDSDEVEKYHPEDSDHGTAQEPEPALKPVISEAQGKRLYAIWKGAGKSDTFVKKHLAESYGLKSTREIAKGGMYDEIVKWAGDKSTNEDA